MMLPEGNRGRFMAIALVLIPLLLVIQLVISPLIAGYRGIGDDIADIQADIVRYRHIIAELPALQNAIDRVENTQPLQPFLLDGSNASLAAANLQRRLQTIAREHDARIVSVRVQPAIAEGPLERVSVKARLQIDSGGLRDTLYAIEMQRPYLFIDALSINKRPQRRGVRAAGPLDVMMTLSGLRESNAAISGADRG